MCLKTRTTSSNCTWHWATTRRFVHVFVTSVCCICMCSCRCGGFTRDDFAQVREVLHILCGRIVDFGIVEYLCFCQTHHPSDCLVWLLVCALVQAGTTAIIIAKQEQEMGNYKVAHAILLQTYQELVNHKLRVPQDVQRMLSLLHSYVIVKKLVKRDDHLSAARMLVRVAKNISKFPSHIVPILTSTGK